MTAKSKYYKMTEGDDLTLRLEEFPSGVISMGTDANGNPYDASSMIASYPIAQELFPISAGDNTGNIYMSEGGYTFGFAFAPKGSFTVTKMRIMCITGGGTAHPLKLGIFKATLGETEYIYTCVGAATLANPQQGLNTVLLDNPVDVEGGNMYYMAVYNPGVNTFLLMSHGTSATLTPLVVVSSPGDKININDTITINAATESRIWMEISQ